jgi:6-pyruvoyltetrahydropterin/6-carboxytetrahydropterin synthase
MPITTWIEVDREDFNFSASQLLVSGGRLEELSGHNYQLSVRLRGRPDVDGIIRDFREVKGAIRLLISELNHRTLVPLEHNSLDVQVSDEVTLTGPGGERIVLPLAHCLLLPIINTSCECLANYVLQRLWEELKLDQTEGCALSVSVGESPGQRAWVERS